MALHRRLLQDIADFRNNPYPNIFLCMHDDLQTACLLLTPTRKKDRPPKRLWELHLCLHSEHQRGYTPAYTLKGIAIQLLSFFSSERIEQQGGGFSIELDDYDRGYSSIMDINYQYKCTKCGFGGSKFGDKGFVIVGQTVLSDPFARKLEQDVSRTQSIEFTNMVSTKAQTITDTGESVLERRHPYLIELILALPDEVILLILDEMDTKDLLAAAKVCGQIGKFLTSYDTLRMRELQCFCLKESFMNAKLGVGIHISRQRKEGNLESEFDLLSQQAFEQFHIRRSIQGLGFEYWLPLPISRRHWRSVRTDVEDSLGKLTSACNLPSDGDSKSRVIYNFMNDIVVKLSREAEQRWDRPKSTLTHASEKAVESYFGLFHLLLCLATEEGQIVRDVNRRMLRFLEGHTSKEACPNLGQLLVAVLISDHGLTETLTLAIIKEAILRNVVWMLDSSGAGMAELSYIEPSAVSDYRLQRTFEASKTSYRLLMFLALFYKTARVPGQSIGSICAKMFDRHGAPPKSTAEKMAAEIRSIRTVDSFPGFFKAMGLVNPPSKENLSSFLKRTIEDSVKMGYSRRAITQGQALVIRMIREPGVEQARDVVPSKKPPSKSRISFFPRKRGKRRR